MLRDIPLSNYSHGASRHHPKCAINKLVMADFVALAIVALVLLVNMNRHPKIIIFPMMGISIFAMFKLTSLFGIANSDVVLNKIWKRYRIYLAIRSFVWGMLFASFTSDLLKRHEKILQFRVTEVAAILLNICFGYALWNGYKNYKT